MTGSSVVSVREPVTPLEELEAFMHDRIAGHKRPPAFPVADGELPERGAGKILRRAPRDEIRAARE